MNKMCFQAWEDLCAPQQVHYEDILNVTAQTAPIHDKTMDGQTDQTCNDSRPVSRAGGSTFLSTWTPAEGDPRALGDLDVTTKVKPKGSFDKSIHHFCTVTEDLQLPDHFRGIWRRYHVPSKADALRGKQVS